MNDFREQRKQEMLWLRKNQFWTLRQIAKKYNIKYQSVQKIIGTNTLDFIPSKYSLMFDTVGQRPDLTNREMAQLIGCSEETVIMHRVGVRHAIAGGKAKLGSEWEEWASRKLTENGIVNRLMPCNAPFDIMAFDSIRIEVKVATKSQNPPSSTRVSKNWAFCIKKDKKPNSSDFFFLIVAPTEDVFVIPNDKLPNISRMSFCYPSLRPELFKWGVYHNAYSIIIPS
jgi:hypothetical protein